MISTTSKREGRKGGKERGRNGSISYGPTKKQHSEYFGFLRDENTGRGKRTQCHLDGGRERRAFWLGAASPIAGACRAWQ